MSPTSSAHAFRVPSNILADLVTETMKDTSSDDSTALVNIKVVSSASSANSSNKMVNGFMQDGTNGNEHNFTTCYEDMKIEIKLRIPSRNANRIKISRDCRSFLQQLFDPFPWGRKNWLSFSHLLQLPWFQRSEVTAEIIENKTALPPFKPPPLQDEFYDHTVNSIVREHRKMSEGGFDYNRSGSICYNEKTIEFCASPHETHNYDVICNDTDVESESKCHFQDSNRRKRRQRVCSEEQLNPHNFYYMKDRYRSFCSHRGNLNEQVSGLFSAF